MKKLTVFDIVFVTVVVLTILATGLIVHNLG
jgi:hypothetical protein